jgi:hypothetical protein
MFSPHLAKPEFAICRDTVVLSGFSLPFLVRGVHQQMENPMKHAPRWFLFLSFITLCGSAFAPTPPPAAVAPSLTEIADSCSLATPAVITWFPKEFECPICKTKNIFMVWGSYGSYIYQDPSKYQLIFWPYTEGAAWYSCKKCRLSIFMGDFESIPAEKIPELRHVLEATTLPKQPERSAKESMVNPPYLEIPTPAKLAVAEKVYRSLGKTDDEFWNHFYRVVGYHSSKPAEADQARQESIAITEKLLADQANDGRRKELLYVLGAMRHFVGNDPGALKAFAEAGKLDYASKDLKPEQNKGYDEYLSKLINEYVEMIRKGEGPRQEDLK